MPLDSAALRAINAQSTGEVFLVLLILSHPAMDQALFFVNNYADVVSNGITYVAWPFDMPMPETGGDTLPSITLTIDNIDRRIGEAIQNINTPIDVTLQVVLASNPNVVELGPLSLRMRSVDVSLTTITGTLVYEDLLNEPFPYETYTPATAPGLF
jgi:hypothetical protein